MTTITRIFDSTTETDRVTFTNSFSNADFIIIQTPDLPSDEGFIIAISLILNVPGFPNREIPLSQEAGDTNLLIRIPQEFSYHKFSQQLLIITAQKIRLIISVISLNCILPDIKSGQENILSKIDELLSNQQKIETRLTNIEQAILAISATIGNGNSTPNPPIETPPIDTNNPLLPGT